MAIRHVSKSAGRYNGERQYYADNRLQNARIEDGAQVIEARVERLSKARYRDWGGQAYTSAKLVARAPLGEGLYAQPSRCLLRPRYAEQSESNDLVRGVKQLAVSHGADRNISPSD